MKCLSNMIMLMLTLVIGAGCCAKSPVNSPKLSTANDVISNIENATVALVMGAPGEKEPYCAGVWIDNTKILTANHCAETLGRKIFDVSENENYDATGDPIVFINYSDLVDNEIPKEVAWVGIIESVDKIRDIAVIKTSIQTSYHTTVRMVNRKINRGEKVHIIGHTLGLSWSYSGGNVAAERIVEGPYLGDKPINSKVLQISAPVWMGNSGGGVFDENGDLIGICSWITLRAPSVAFFIHVEEIQKSLNKTLL